MYTNDLENKTLLGYNKNNPKGLPKPLSGEKEKGENQ